MIPDFYQAKFVAPNGKTIYGILDRFSDEAKRAATDGHGIVEDAITPQRYKVPLTRLVGIPIEYGNEYDKFVESEFNKALKTSEGLKGLVVGKLFAVPVADGEAWYVVTKVAKTKVTIEWRGFSPDRYLDRRFGYGGSVPKRDVECFTRLADFKFHA